MTSSSTTTLALAQDQRGSVAQGRRASCTVSRRTPARAKKEFETFRDAYPAKGGAPAHKAAYAAAEKATTTLFCWQPFVVHALLPTAEYASAILNLPGGPVDQGQARTRSTAWLPRGCAAPQSATSPDGQSRSWSAKLPSATPPRHPRSLIGTNRP